MGDMGANALKDSDCPFEIPVWGNMSAEQKLAKCDQVLCLWHLDPPVLLQETARVQNFFELLNNLPFLGQDVADSLLANCFLHTQSHKDAFLLSKSVDLPNHFQRAPNPPEFAQPKRGGTNLGVFVPIWPVMRMP